jgi:hypothetical protein
MRSRLGPRPFDVIPGCATWRRPGIHNPCCSVFVPNETLGLWIPGSRGACHRARIRATRWRCPQMRNCASGNDEKGKRCVACLAPFAKIFSFPSEANHLHIFRIPARYRGAFRDRHERRVGMRWTQVALLTRAQSCGRRSRVVLTPRRWRQVGERNFTNDGGKQARSPGRARSSR